MSKIITAITEWFRSLLWSIAEIFLFLLDSLWKIVLKIGTLNIGESTVTTKFFTVMSICMLLFIVFKLVKIYIKFFIDSDYRGAEAQGDRECKSARTCEKADSGRDLCHRRDPAWSESSYPGVRKDRRERPDRGCRPEGRDLSE